MSKRLAECLPREPNPDKIVDIPLRQLQLDEANARLAWRTNGASQRELLQILWTEMAVEEVAWSIAKNGFFRSEPLFVVVKDPAERNADRQEFIVVEGNRRLAAVLLLTDRELRAEVGATSLPPISATRSKQLNTLRRLCTSTARAFGQRWAFGISTG
jgi:hypothetical protein